MVRKTLKLEDPDEKLLKSAQELSTSNLPIVDSTGPSHPASKKGSKRAGPQGARETHGPSKKSRGKNPGGSGKDPIVVESPREAGPPSRFVPKFRLGEGKYIALSDCLTRNPGLGTSLLEGVALPEDMKLLPDHPIENQAELCYHLAKAAQCAYRGYKDMNNVAREFNGAEREKKRLLEELQRRDEHILRMDEALNKGAEEEAKLAQQLKEQEEALPAKLKAAADAGFNECVDEYNALFPSKAAELKLKGFNAGQRATHPVSFLAGFQLGLDYAHVPKDDHRREPPVVPDLGDPLSGHPPPEPLPAEGEDPKEPEEAADDEEDPSAGAEEEEAS